MTTITTQSSEAFTEEVFGHYTGAFITYMIDIGARTGLLDAAAGGGPSTSQELAERSGLHERYVREWLGSMVTAGIFDYDAPSGTYTLPQERAACLSGTSELNVAPLAQIAGHLANFIDPVATAFRRGGGVPYSAFRPEFTDVMDALSRPLFDGALVDGIVPTVEGLHERLVGGARAIDIGCGTGHATNVLARAYPASTFTGYDLAADAIERARDEASEYGIRNATFEIVDVARLTERGDVDVAFAFDAIHDQADPAGVLARIFDALTPGGVFVMFDIRASSHLENNVGNPMAPMLYAISTLHCMTVSLAAGGVGLGTVWGEELAVQMLRDAGFEDIEVHEVPADPLDSVYVARKPA